MRTTIFGARRGGWRQGNGGHAGAVSPLESLDALFECSEISWPCPLAYRVGGP
jgi:hypothetical protein